MPQRIVRAGVFLAFTLVVIIASPAGPTGVGAATNPPQRANLSAVPGTIAYTRDFTTLHLVQPDTSNDRTVWTEPAGAGNAIYDAAWRPDGKEIAFASNHEQVTSQLISDIYGVQPDGTGLRRITDPPDPSQYGSYAKGTVVVNVSDFDVAGPFVIWMEGAPAPQSSSGNGTLTFTNVAIFPGHVQFPVAMNGFERWIPAGGGVTVQPGGTVTTSLPISSGSALDHWGAFTPVWRRDSAQIDFRLGSACVGNSLPTNPAAGDIGQLLMQFSVPLCTFDRGPTPALANQILYWTLLGPGGNAGFFQAPEGSTDGGTLLLPTGFGEYAYSAKYLPDGSGFLFAKSDSATNFFTSNIYAYDFGTHATTQLTHFTDANNNMEFAANLSISPDGTTIVFEHSTQDPIPTNGVVPQDLWIMTRDGSVAPGLFIANARTPSWSRTGPPVPLPPRVFLPVVFH